MDNSSGVRNYQSPRSRYSSNQNKDMTSMQNLPCPSALRDVTEDISYSSRPQFDALSKRTKSLTVEDIYSSNSELINKLSKETSEPKDGFS